MYIMYTGYQPIILIFIYGILIYFIDRMGYGQTTKNDNGDGPHSRFPGFVHIPSTGSW